MCVRNSFNINTKEMNYFLLFGLIFGLILRMGDCKGRNRFNRNIVLQLWNWIYIWINLDASVCALKNSADLCGDAEPSLVIRYYYNAKRNLCDDFLFDIDCSSTGNVFETKKECEKTCKNAEYDDSQYVSLFSTS